MTIILQYSIIGLTYLGLSLGYLPGLRMNRATIAMFGATALLATGALDLKSAWGAIDYRTLIFLFSMMVVSASLATRAIKHPVAFAIPAEFGIRH